jgi:hypothetical protein
MITRRNSAGGMIIAGLAAEKVLTGKTAFGSVYAFHRLRGVFRDAV